VWFSTASVSLKRCTGNAFSKRAIRPFTTSQHDVRIEHLLAVSATSFCEWKGIARYFDVHVDGKRVTRAAWAYPDPTPEFIAIKNYIAFYGHLMDACFVGDELARPQPGSFYGGWITNNIIGPFKREPGTARS
jgi:hypothetical protein